MTSRTRLTSIITLLIVLATALGLAGSRARGQETPATAIAPASAQAALGTSIPYQGQLTDGSAPANGTYDFQFKLFDDAGAGNPIGSEVVKEDVAVANGLFAVELDFGPGAFNGEARFLEIGVRPGVSTDAFTPLSPRRPLLAVPYALYSLASAGGNSAYGAAVGGPQNSTYVAANGNLGVGMVERATDPLQKLHVYGGDLLVEKTGSPKIFLWSRGNGTHQYSLRVTAQDDSAGQRNFVIRNESHGTDDFMISNDGKVGIGTADPQFTLDVNGITRLNSSVIIRNPNNTTGAVQLGWENNQPLIRLGGPTEGGAVNGLNIQRADDILMRITAGGNVGIGTATPHAKLEVAGNVSVGGRLGIGSHLSIAGSDFIMAHPDSGDGGRALVHDDNDTLTINRSGDFAGGVKVGSRLTVPVLRITGGDLAEPFAIADADGIQPGMVVAIDPDTPGQMRLSIAAYDRTVAGVVSGAGGIDTGVLMYEGADGENTHPVALSGRVYVYADAANGAIEPGDLLTTADTPGHAMKVIDYERAQGAILGKAMSRLGEGTGLVLVLVTLQ